MEKLIEYSIDKIIGSESFATFDKRIITMKSKKHINKYWDEMNTSLPVELYQLTMWKGNIGTVIWTKRIK